MAAQECPFHGWSFDHNGICAQIPCEVPTRNLCVRVNRKSPLCAPHSDDASCEWGFAALLRVRQRGEHAPR